MKSWLKKLLVPKTANRSMILSINSFVAAMATVYINQSQGGDHLGSNSLLGTVFLLLILVAVVYLVVAGVLVWREKQRSILRAETVDYLPLADDYRSVNYSQLPIARQVMPPDVPIVIGISLLALTALIIGLLVFTPGRAEAPIHEPTTIMVLWILGFILGAAGLALSWLGWRLNRASGQGSFDGFLADNSFTITRQPQLEAQREFYQSLIEQTSYPIYLRGLQSEISGTYRGRPFYATTIKAGRQRLQLGSEHYGMIVYPSADWSNVDDDQRQSLIDTHQRDKGMTVRFTNQYLVIYSRGTPSRRSGMMQLFQSLDDFI